MICGYFWAVTMGVLPKLINDSLFLIRRLPKPDIKTLCHKCFFKLEILVLFMDIKSEITEENSEIKKIFSEAGVSNNHPDDPFEVSDAETMLKYLKEVL